MKRTMLICLCASTLALCTCASLAEMKGTSPNATGDTVIDKDTVWRGQNIVLGRNLTVKSGASLTIDNCDVLFKGVWPEGKMTCENKTTIVINDSYIHGRGEKEFAERAAGIVLGKTWPLPVDKLTVKISGTTFKYLGDGWRKQKPHGMVHAPAHYTRGSYFKRNSFICDSRPMGSYGRRVKHHPPTNAVWAFIGVGRRTKPERKGLTVEDCYFYQPDQAIWYNRYVRNSTFLGTRCPIHAPSHFVLEGNRFYDNTGKALDFFNQSSHGLVKDNFVYNTAICLADFPGSVNNLFKDNIIIGIDSSYRPGWRQATGGGGNGDGHMFIGNEYIGFTGGAIGICGKDWLIAGNKITNCYGMAVGMHPYYDGNTKRGISGGDVTIVGNIIEKCKGAGHKYGMIQINRGSSTPDKYKWKGAVIAGNTIKNCLFYVPPRGIKLSNTENIVIKGNIIKNNSIGVEISPEVSFCNIIGNDISGNKKDIIGKPSDSEEFPKAEIVSPAANEFKKGRAVVFKGKGTARGGKKIVSYRWFFGDDGKTSTKQNPTHAFKKDGKYFVCLIVTDSAGLKDVALMPGRIEAVWNREDPKRPWPGKKPRLAVYPNPLYLCSNSNPAFVLYNYRGKPSLKIYDSKNKMVKEFKKFSMNAEELDNFRVARIATVKKINVDFYECLKEWNRKEISPGKYTAVASDEDGEVARCRFVVK